MKAIKGIYDGKIIKLLEPIHLKKNAEVLITPAEIRKEAIDKKSSKDLIKAFTSYYRALTLEDQNQHRYLAEELDILDFGTNNLLEDQED